MQVVWVYLAILLQVTLEMCAAAKNCKKFTKTPILGDQGRSRSLILINARKPVLVMVYMMYVPICDHFHATRANSSKITTF